MLLRTPARRERAKGLQEQSGSERAAHGYANATTARRSASLKVQGPVSGLTRGISPALVPSHGYPQWPDTSLRLAYRCGGSVSFALTSRFIRNQRLQTPIAIGRDSTGLWPCRQC